MSPEFTELVAAVDASTRNAPSGSYVPYDIALYKYVSRHASIWSANIHRFRYTDVIQNTLGRTPSVVQAILDGDFAFPPVPVYASTYLVHAGRHHIEETLRILIPFNERRIAEQLAEDERVERERKKNEKRLSYGGTGGDEL
jgi:hypothetical protein